MSRENRKSNEKSKNEPEERPAFGQLSRRTFLSRLGATGAAAAAASPLLGLAQTQVQQEPARDAGYGVWRNSCHVAGKWTGTSGANRSAHHLVRLFA